MYDTSMSENEDKVICPDCDKEEGTFACRIRHIHMNTGAANSKREWENDRRKTAQVKKYGI